MTGYGLLLMATTMSAVMIVLQITQYTSLISRSKSAMSPVRIAAPESIKRAANDPIFGDTTTTLLSRERPATIFKTTK